MLEISGRQQTIRFLEYVYKNANLFLDRKMNLANNILNYIIPIKELKKCIIDNCTKKHEANNYCQYHNYHLNGGKEKRKERFIKFKK